MKYFSYIEEGHLPDRSFMWIIQSILRGKFCKKLIEATRNTLASDSASTKMNWLK